METIKNKLNGVHFMSQTNEWATPQDFFCILNDEYRFTLDPCATIENAKCEKFFTIEENGLEQDWSRETVFMNPPYGREIGKWMKKAYEEACKGATVVCLIPSRTDTKYWHDYAMQGEIRFVKGRIKFGNSDNSAPFPSAVVIFKGKYSAFQRK